MKRIPERTCVCCRNKFPQTDLIRVVRFNGSFFVDVTGRADGRGAYFCGSDDCKKKLIKSRALDRAFRQKVEQSVYDDLLTFSNKEGN